MAGSTLVQLRVPDDLLARIDEACGESTRTAWLLGLAVAELDDAGPDGGPLPAATGQRYIGPGIPAPGVLCMWARCGSRDSDRYGVTDLGELTRDYSLRPRDEDKAGIALCKHHAAILEGRVYQAPRRDLPPSWMQKVQRGVPEPA